MDSALYRVRRWHYFGLFLLCIGLGLFCYFAAPEFRRPGKFYIVAIAMALAAPFALWETIAATDLKFDGRGIRYKGKTIGWREVREIRVHCHSTTTHRGLMTDWASHDQRIGDVPVHQLRQSVGVPSLIVIPIESGSEEIKVDWRGGTLTVRGGSLALPPGGVIAVAQRMIDLQTRLLGEQGVIRARLGLEEEVASVALDPAPPPAPARPTFGRKGVPGSA